MKQSHLCTLIQLLCSLVARLPVHGQILPVGCVRYLQAYQPQHSLQRDSFIIQPQVLFVYQHIGHLRPHLWGPLQGQGVLQYQL